MTEPGVGSVAHRSRSASYSGTEISATHPRFYTLVLSPSWSPREPGYKHSIASASLQGALPSPLYQVGVAPPMPTPTCPKHCTRDWATQGHGFPVWLPPRVRTTNPEGSRWHSLGLICGYQPRPKLPATSLALCFLPGGVVRHSGHLTVDHQPSGTESNGWEEIGRDLDAENLKKEIGSVVNSALTVRCWRLQAASLP